MAIDLLIDSHSVKLISHSRDIFLVFIKILNKYLLRQNTQYQLPFQLLSVIFENA